MHRTNSASYLVFPDLTNSGNVSPYADSTADPSSLGSILRNWILIMPSPPTGQADDPKPTADGK